LKDDNNTGVMGSGQNFVVGRNPVLELLKSGRDIDKLFVANGNREGSVTVIVAEALKRKVPVIEVDRSKLDSISDGVPHQGVAAMVPEKNYSTIDEILEYAESRGERPLVVIADGIEDPHNLGAMIRTAECAGAHGLIIPKRHSSGLTQVVTKASAGAIEHLRIAKVSNLAQTVEELKKRGLWIYAAETGGIGYTEGDYTIASALIFGSEGKGISHLLKTKSDYIISIPLLGKISSLNVSNAAAVVLYEAVRQRNLN
jgi:rRNA methylase, putative, group 3